MNVEIDRGQNNIGSEWQGGDYRPGRNCTVVGSIGNASRNVIEKGAFDAL